jgi:glutamate/tyrosine decarboxylase-like PLP-dependent enzyme
MQFSGNWEELLSSVQATAVQYLSTLEIRPVFAAGDVPAVAILLQEGLGEQAAIAQFRSLYEDRLAASAGPRYLGFVTGGATPAALAADWLVSVYDQNAGPATGTCAGALDRQAVDLLRQLFALPEDFAGSLVTGATMANFTGFATARQWWARQHGRDAAEVGCVGLPTMPIFAATPHSSAAKALAMLGAGRRAIRLVPTLPEREAMDVSALATALAAEQGKPSIVCASAGTVNTGDFDDLMAIAELCRKHNAWLHVDGAFGLFAACSAKHEHYLAGLAAADSIASDAHKWLNVPYESGFCFTRHIALQEEVFRIGGAYLNVGALDAFHRTPESSRRLRALPIWMTLQAYGRAGYRELVDRNCACAEDLGQRIQQSKAFRLLAPVRLNVVCFTTANEAPAAFLQRLAHSGEAFLTPTTLHGVPAIRAAFSNWRTTHADVDQVWAAMTKEA